MLKILVLSPIMPEKNNPRIDYVNFVYDYLKSKIPTKIIWVIYQPDKIIQKNESDCEILDIHNFPNAQELLEKIKPDLFLSNHTLDPINTAVSLVAILKKIPIICFEHGYFSFKTISIQTNKINLLFSNKLPSENESQKKFLKRFNFYFYKFSFLLKTRMCFSKKIKEYFVTLLDIYKFITGNFPKLNPYGNIYLIPGKFVLNNNNYNKLKNIKPVKIVGNPYWDNLSNKIRFSEPTTSEKIRILIITDSLYEHGFWTYAQKNNFLSQLLTNLNSDPKLIFDLKIHPSSENFEFYNSLLKKLKVKAKIFQKENLWDVARNYDLFLTYGYSQVHSELAYSGKKVILLDSNVNLPLITLVNEAIEIGNIKQCKNEKSLIPIIHHFFKEKSIITNDFNEAASNYFAISDGTSSEKIGKIILELLSKENKKEYCL